MRYEDGREKGVERRTWFSSQMVKNLSKAAPGIYAASHVDRIHVIAAANNANEERILKS